MFSTCFLNLYLSTRTTSPTPSSPFRLTRSFYTTAGSRDYAAFGAVTASAGTGLDRYGYTAREWDATLGLQYTRTRLYDPASGRLLREDPLGLAGGDANTLRYAGNAVTMYSDPSGMLAHIAFGAVVGAVGGYAVNGFVNVANGRRFNRNGWQAAVGGAVGGAVGAASRLSTAVAAGRSVGRRTGDGDAVYRALTDGRVDAAGVGGAGGLGRY